MGSIAQAAPREDFADSTVTTQPTKLWTEPGQFGEATAILDPGLHLEVLRFNTASDWAQVRTPSGREGWVPVRYTALSGQHSTASISGSRERSPAGNFDGIPTEGTAATASASASTSASAPAPLRQIPQASNAKSAKVASHSSEHQAGASLEYFQRLTPESMPGIAVRPSFLFHLSNEFWLGPGLDFSYSGKTSSQQGTVMASLRQSHMRLAPMLVARRLFGAFRLDAALGIDFERTSLTTTDLTTGTIISVYNGLRYSGSAWDTALALRLQPAYVFPLDESSNLAFTVGWSLRADFSSGQGPFAGSPGSGYSHALSAGLAFTSEF